MATDPKWQISFRGMYDSLRLLYLRLFNEEARTVELMELQLKHMIELMLAEERICLERHEQELAVRRARVLYLESVTSEEAEFQERTEWRKKLPSLPRWPSRRKGSKRKPRGADRCADGDEPVPKRKCSTRSKVAGVFMSGASAALIRDGFPEQKGVVVSKTALIPEDLLNVSLEEVIFTTEWAPEVILPDPFQRLIPLRRIFVRLLRNGTRRSC